MSIMIHCLLLELLLLCHAKTSGMWCSEGGFEGFIVHGKHAMNKWRVTKTAATKGFKSKQAAADAYSKAVLK